MKLTTWLAAAAAGALLITVACSGPKTAAPPQPAAGPASIDRTVLPIPEPDYPRETELDARKATPPPRFEVKAPAGAPNVLIVLIDDMGFGMSSAFGGPGRGLRRSLGLGPGTGRRDQPCPCRRGNQPFRQPHLSTPHAVTCSGYIASFW